MIDLRDFYITETYHYVCILYNFLNRTYLTFIFIFYLSFLIIASSCVLYTFQNTINLELMVYLLTMQIAFAFFYKK